MSMRDEGNPMDCNLNSMQH